MALTKERRNYSRATNTVLCCVLFCATVFAPLLGVATRAQAALICGTPGSSGSGNPTGVINDYWVGSGSPGAGSGSITLGARRAGGAGNSIVAGDLVLIIQMQDADINNTNTTNYGSNSGTGSGSTAINRVGLYEYVLATNTVGVAGGALTFTPNLTNSYRTRAYVAGNNGQSTWQAILIPQYSSATASAVTTPAWNGTTGGLVAMDVENELTLAGGTAINVAGLGFRGGASRSLGGGAGANTDFRTLSTVANNASKGEGIAGAPRWINNTSAYNAAPNVVDTGVEGYPNGSHARGAPGNAGGGGTDGRPSNNDQNSGGGGGSNYGFGGQGGNAWSSGATSGGRGGAPYSGVLAANRVFLGGGGGGGTTNNATFDNATYAAPPGVACNIGFGYCSSGAAGGGIVIIRAGSISGSGLVDARGADGYNVENDGAGGGGGGGTIVLQSYFGGSATVNVSGGNGGNAWRSRNTLIDRHGPGGGGGGGFIAYSPSTGFAVTATYAAGLSGLSSNDDPFGSTSGNGGITAFDLPVVPGVQAGAFCPPALKAVTLAVDNGTPGAIDPGDTLEYTVVYRNASTGSISGFNITDPLPAGVSFIPGSLTVTPSGGAPGSANAAYNGTTTPRLLSSDITLPIGGIITARLRATAVAAACTNVFNQANSVQSSGDALGLTDNADSTQNEGGLPSGTYIDQAPFGTAGATDPTGFTMGCPNLSTSSKTWVDLNGGDQNPGEVLRYTITLTDSGGGEATGVTVTDHIPANVNTFTVVSFPAGATNSSTYSGTGSNLTGYLNITNITVPANGSVTIVFDVTINSGTPAGTAIDNTATVTNPFGPGATPTAPRVTVALSSIPSSGTKQLYLQAPNSENSPTLPQALSRTPLTAYPTVLRVRIRRQDVRYWDLTPVLQAPLTLNANTTVVLQMEDSNSNSLHDLRLTLGYNAGAGLVVLAQQDFTNMDISNGLPVAYAFNLTTPAVTIPAGSILQLTVDNEPDDAGGATIYVHPYVAYSGTPDTSRVELNSATVINVDSIGTFSDVAYPGGAPITTAQPGDIVRIRSTVSDPFGSYDISTATITLTDPLGVVTVNNLAMTEVFDSTIATKVYEYVYTIPAGGPTGIWDIRVVANEGTEGLVSDYGLETMTVAVPLPLLTIVKSANKATVNPGETILYTVQVANTGTGAATTVVLTDRLGQFTAFGLNTYGVGIPFVFTDSAPASGLALGPLEYSADMGSSWLYTPVSGGGGAPAGYDGNLTNWRLPLTGSLRAGGSFTLNYRVIVK